MTGKRFRLLFDLTRRLPSLVAWAVFFSSLSLSHCVCSSHLRSRFRSASFPSAAASSVASQDVLLPSPHFLSTFVFLSQVAANGGRKTEKNIHHSG